MAQPYVPQIDDGETAPPQSRLQRAKAVYRDVCKQTWGSKKEEFATPEEEEKHEEGQAKAIIMMNFFCLANTGQCVLYKIMD